MYGDCGGFGFIVFGDVDELVRVECYVVVDFFV